MLTMFSRKKILSNFLLTANNMKIGLLITARLKSTRLPLKLLLDLNGKSVIERVIERSHQIVGIDQVILCTSLNYQDKPLTDIALRNNTHYFLGSEEDVLQRLHDASKYFDLDYVLSITGENPLFSIEYANRTVDLIKKYKADFTLFEGLPIGCAVYGLKVKALDVVCRIKQEIDTEIWGPLFKRPELFDLKIEKVNDFYFRPELRITNDYFEDYQFLNAIFNHYNKEEIPSLFSVLSLLDCHPEYLSINREKVQSNLSEEKLNSINKYYLRNISHFRDVKEKIYST